MREGELSITPLVRMILSPWLDHETHRFFFACWLVGFVLFGLLLIMITIT